MKLIYKVILTFLIPLTLTLGMWGWLSYRTMARKVHADTDLILRDYSADIIMRILSGKELPERFNGAYNTYYIEKISPEEAAEGPAVEYAEAELYLRSQEDFASSRVRRQVFQDSEGNYHRLTVSLPTFEQDVLVEHVLMWTVLLFVVLLVSLVLIGVLLFNYNMKPLYRLLNWIDGYEPGQPYGRIPSDTDILEFRKLIAAVEDAVTRFETQFEERKIFIGNASHELQTPLAVCSNRIEMLLERPDINEEIANELVRIHRSLSSLVRLIKTMLLLSKIENGQFPQTADVNVNSLALESIEMYQEIYEHKNLCIDVDQGAEFMLRIDEQMACVLVNNLIKNAFVYSPEGGSVQVSFTSSGLCVSNDGDSPLDKDKVFRRFYQPLGRKEGATGLGLALVNSVCMNNGLDVSYDFRNGTHVFAVTLKKSI